MWKLITASAKMLYRDRNSLFWALAFPIIFVVTFGLFNFEQAPHVQVAVVAVRPSPLSMGLVTALRQVASVTVTEQRSLAVARDDLTAGTLDMVVVVPAVDLTGPSASPVTLQAIYSDAHVQTAPLALTTLRQVVAALNLRVVGITTPPLAVAPTPVSTRQITYYDWLLPGLIAMGVMTFSIGGFAVALARFRERSILKRILATPLAPARFLAAQVLTRVLLALTQTALILAIGLLIFHAHVYGSLVWIFVLAALANLAFLNIGIVVASRAPTSNAAWSMAQAIALPMMFLSGVFYPTDTLPAVVRAAVPYLPLTPVTEALRAVALDGRSITATGPQLLVLGCWAVLSFAVASRTFHFSAA